MPNTTIQQTQAKTGSSRLSSTRTNKPSTTSTSRRPKGKSKYAHKARVNANKPKAVVKQGPVKSYTSVCHGAPATKPACVRVGKKDALVQGLGSWRCTVCKKPCKVTVSKATVAESLTKEGWKPSDALRPGEEVVATVLSNTGGEYAVESLKVLEGMPPARTEVPSAG